MLVLIYTSQSIHRLTCCGKPVKFDLPLSIKEVSAVIGKQVLAFGKSEKSEFIYIGSFGLSGVTRIWGPNIGRSRRNRVRSHVWLILLDLTSLLNTEQDLFCNEDYHPWWFISNPTLTHSQSLCVICSRPKGKGIPQSQSWRLLGQASIISMCYEQKGANQLNFWLRHPLWTAKAQTSCASDHPCLSLCWLFIFVWSCFIYYPPLYSVRQW